MICLLFKSINPATRICVSNLKYEIDKATLSKFGNKANTLLMTCPQTTISLFIEENST